MQKFLLTYQFWKKCLSLSAPFRIEKNRVKTKVLHHCAGKSGFWMVKNAHFEEIDSGLTTGPIV